jgi:pimeloyl-ACP methyl ester carboxylesterase
MHQLAPHATLAVIEEAGHMAPMERPDAVVAEILRWLDT